MTTPGISLRAVPVPETRAMQRGERPGVPGLRWHAEYPMADTLSAIGMLERAYEFGGHPVRVDGAAPAWWIFQMVLDGEVVGDCGFHGPPSAESPAVVEIGYNVVPARRRRGIAGRACAYLLEVAWRQGADVVVAETDLDNVASQNVLLRNGFHFVGPGQYLVLNPLVEQVRR